MSGEDEPADESLRESPVAAEEPPSSPAALSDLLDEIESSSDASAPVEGAEPDAATPSAVATTAPPSEAAVHAYPDDETPSVLWGDVPPSSLLSLAEVEAPVEQSAAQPTPEPDVADEQEEPERYEEAVSYPVAPKRRSLGGAIFSLFLLLLLAAAGVLAFKWLQADVRSQGGGSDIVDPSEGASGAPRR